MPGTERLPVWPWRAATLVLWSLALAASYTGDERFTAKLVQTFAAILVLIHAVVFRHGSRAGAATPKIRQPGWQSRSP